LEILLVVAEAIVGRIRGEVLGDLLLLQGLKSVKNQCADIVEAEKFAREIDRAKGNGDMFVVT
jgi:hypothetical protein